MACETKELDESKCGLVEPRYVESDLERIARELADEFRAPVGIFDPSAKAWRVTVAPLNRSCLRLTAS